MNTENKLLSVHEYIGALNAALKSFEARITGEVIVVNIWSTGHVYFSLKDKQKDAVLECVMWSNAYRVNGVKIEKGMEVIATGYSNVYEQKGKLSFVTNTLELVGEGALKRAYEELKLKLTKEGVFAIEKKRPLPKFVHKIGLITSKREL